MPGVRLPLIAPITDLSVDHTFGEFYPQPPLGALLGDGSLDNPDDGNGVELWDPTVAHSQQAGQDIYRYSLQAGEFPADATLTGVSVEIVATYAISGAAVEVAAARHAGSVVEVGVNQWLIDYGRAGVDEFDSTRVNAAAGSTGIRVSVDGSTVTGLLVLESAGPKATVSNSLSLGLMTADEWTDGTHTVTLQGFQNDLGTIAPVASAIVTAAWIVLSYELPTARPLAEHCRVWPRDDGFGPSPRLWPRPKTFQTPGNAHGVH